MSNSSRSKKPAIYGEEKVSGSSKSIGKKLYCQYCGTLDCGSCGGKHGHHGKSRHHGKKGSKRSLSSEEEEERYGKGYHDYSGSYTTTTTEEGETTSETEESSVTSETEESEGMMKKINKKLKKTAISSSSTSLSIPKSIISLKKDEVVITFAVYINTKKNETFNLTNGDGFKIIRFTDPSHFKSAKSINNTNDIVHKMELKLSGTYPGSISLTFPTIKDGKYNYYDSGNSISTMIQSGKLLGDGISKELYKKELNENEIEFLNKYPGQTTNNFNSRDFISFQPGRKGKEYVHVGLDPESCVLHFYRKDNPDKFIGKNSDNPHAYVMYADEYDKYSKITQEKLDKMFSFSNVTGDKFSIEMKVIENDILQKRAKEIGKASDTRKKMLEEKGFSNFYNAYPDQNPNHKSISNSQLTKYEEFKKTPFKIEGELTIEYTKNIE